MPPYVRATLRNELFLICNIQIKHIKKYMSITYYVVIYTIHQDRFCAPTPFFRPRTPILVPLSTPRLCRCLSISPS